MGYLLLNRKSDKQFSPQQEVAECFNGAKVINIFGFINKSSFFLNLKLYLCCINNNMKDWFMNIDEVQLITFSPTCTSKQVGEAIVHGTGISSVSKVDLTLEAAGKREVPSHALAVITVPVYGGHVAPLALERMKELHADGAPAVVVVVYGNRAYEKALVELDAFVTKLGFKVIAGATFVGEHSYSSEKYPVAAGRPDADDLEYAKLFGEKIRAKIAAAEDMEKLYGVDVTRIQRRAAFSRCSAFCAESSSCVRVGCLCPVLRKWMRNVVRIADIA